MRVLFFLLASQAFAADPPYFSGKVDGIYWRSLVDHEPAQFLPGKLTDCVQQSATSSYRSWTCQTDKAELKVQSGGKLVNFSFDRLTVAEHPSGPGGVVTLLHTLIGAYQEESEGTGRVTLVLNQISSYVGAAWGSISLALDTPFQPLVEVMVWFPAPKGS